MNRNTVGHLEILTFFCNTLYFLLFVGRYGLKPMDRTLDRLHRGYLPG